MATVTEIRDRLPDVLAAVEGLSVAVRPAESPPSVLPSLVVGEPVCDFAEGDSSRGLDRWDFPMVLLVEMGDYQLASEALDAYLARQGPKSIRAAFAAEPMLGLLDGTRAYLDRLEDYGPRDSVDGQRMAGAVLHLIVRTAG